MRPRLDSSGAAIAALLPAILAFAPAATRAAGTVASATAALSKLGEVIPRPVSVVPAEGAFVLGHATRIYVDDGRPDVEAVGRFLAERLRPATGYRLRVARLTGAPTAGHIRLTTDGAAARLGDEGYALAITPNGVTLSAPTTAGLFWGVQTLRQLLPPAIESRTRGAGPWTLPAGRIEDRPRFVWRGFMLDVARHFFTVDDVKRYVDLAAYYKLNRLHLHLTDDQGWRLEIRSWPQLAERGGASASHGDRGGHFSRGDYRKLVAYAAARYVTVIPEIDLPGHTNAALASYAELNCDGRARPPYGGDDVGFSSLCIGGAVTFRFVDDVIREVAELTPGPYIHIGGDEASNTTDADYVKFVERAQEIVIAHGKRMLGWEEVAKARLAPTSVVQFWANAEWARAAVKQGRKIVLSPSRRAYLDMKYTAATPLGQDWAALVEARDAYDWDPADAVEGVSEGDLLGVEAALWTETLATPRDLDYMAFPRLAGLAEVAWSPAERRCWDEYRLRLARHAARLDALGVAFYRSPQIDW